MYLVTFGPQDAMDEREVDLVSSAVDMVGHFDRTTNQAGQSADLLDFTAGKFDTILLWIKKRLAGEITRLW